MEYLEINFLTLSLPIKAAVNEFVATPGKLPNVLDSPIKVPAILFKILRYNDLIIYYNDNHFIFYFENVAFFHAKLGLDVCPRVDNQTSGETLQDLTRPPSGKIAISQLSTHGNWNEFLVAGCPSTPTSSD